MNASATILSATTEKLRELGEAVEVQSTATQMVSRAPRDEGRELRTFRAAEVMSLMGITAHTWRRWLDEHRENLDHGHAPGGAKVTLEEMHRLMGPKLPSRPAGTRAKRVLIQNFKGGAQKTTVCLHLSQFLALRGYRCLMIDTDPQATLSRCMGFIPEQVASENTIAGLFSEKGDLFSGRLKPMPTHFHNIKMVPASLGLTTMDFDIARAFMSGDPNAKRFYAAVDEALVEFEDDYDFILFDSPPAFSFLGISLAWAADSLVVTMPTEVIDFSATGDFLSMAGEFLQEIEQATEIQKSWMEFLVVHGRVAQGASSDMVMSLSARVFQEHRVASFISASRPIANCLATFQSVFEVTSNSELVDSRSLKRAREQYEILGRQMEGLLTTTWPPARETQEGENDAK